MTIPAKPTFQKPPPTTRGRESAKKTSLRESLPTKKNYKDGILGILQLVGGMAFAVNPPDACAVIAHAENVAEATADLATADERVAAILDKLLEVGPYGALIGAVAPMVAQILCNHKVIKPGILGTLPEDELVSHVIGGGPKEDSKSENSANGRTSHIPT